MNPVAWLFLIIAGALWPLVFIAHQDELDSWDDHWDDVCGLFE